MEQSHQHYRVVVVVVAFDCQGFMCFAGIVVLRDRDLLLYATRSPRGLSNWLAGRLPIDGPVSGDACPEQGSCI